MSKPEIIRKLTKELEAGIETEVQVVYLLTGIRKLMERDGVKKNHPDLTFYCDWVLHAQLSSNSVAQKILREFSEANKRLKDEKIEIKDLPDVQRISEMKTLREDLSKFISDYGLPSLTEKRADGWTKFLYLYCNVIQDIPLVVQDPAVQDISHVVVQLKEVKHETEVLFQVNWTIFEKNGKMGTVFVINSFSGRERSAREPLVRKGPAKSLTRAEVGRYEHHPAVYEFMQTCYDNGFILHRALF